MEQPLTFRRKGTDDVGDGIGKDISLGGMFIETRAPAPFGTEVEVVTSLPGEAVALTLPAVVRWTKPSGMGVQFGLIGARETHMITELARKRDESR